MLTETQTNVSQSPPSVILRKIKANLWVPAGVKRMSNLVPGE
jgi:hypothetical protein